MKKILAALFIGALAIAAPVAAPAQSISDLLGKLGGSSSTTSTVGNILSGIFSSTDFTVADIAGEYTSNGPAVTFKSDNFLQKAGGIAGAAAIESKLAPYYQQYGLDGMKLTIAHDGKFTMTIKKMKLMGILEENTADGANFTFKFQAFGKIKLGSLNAYIEKSGSQLDVMFDASKLKSLISAVGNFSGIKLAKAAASILDSYDGACIGFKMNKTGDVAAPADDNGTSASSSKSGLGSLLKGVLGGASSQQGEVIEETTEEVIEQPQSTPDSEQEKANSLLNLLKKK